MKWATGVLAALFMALPLQADATITFVQSHVNTSISSQVVLSSPPTQGDLLVAVVNDGNGSDAAAATYTKIVGASTDGGPNSSVVSFYYKIAGASESATQTVLTAQYSLSMIEFSSTLGFPSNPVNQSSSGFSSSSTNPPTVTTSSLTPTVSGCLAIVGDDSPTADTAPAAPAGTTSWAVPTAAAGHTARHVYQLNIGTSSYSVVLTWGSGSAAFSSYGIAIFQENVVSNSIPRLMLMGVGRVAFAALSVFDARFAGL